MMARVGLLLAVVEWKRAGIGGSVAGKHRVPENLRPKHRAAETAPLDEAVTGRRRCAELGKVCQMRREQ